MVFVYKKGILEVHKACLFDTMCGFCCHDATICQTLTPPNFPPIFKKSGIHACHITFFVYF